jgi:hypothetical protein
MVKKIVEVMVRRIKRLQMNLEGRGHGLLKADLYIAGRAHAVQMPFPFHAVPLRV